MTRTEAAQVLAVLKAAYPNSYKGMTKEEALGTVGVWAMQFADMPADIVIMAVHKCIATNTFPPSVAEVKKYLQHLYWEAWTMLNNGVQLEPLSDQKKAQLRRIMDATDEHRHLQAEPTLEDFMNHTQQIGGGALGITSTDTD